MGKQLNYPQINCCGKNCEAMIPTDLYQVEYAQVDDETFFACTPRCLYEGIRDYLENRDMANIQEDLLKVTSQDLYELIQPLMEQAYYIQAYTFKLTNKEGDKIRDSWERLGHVLGQLNLRVPGDDEWEPR